MKLKLWPALLCAVLILPLITYAGSLTMITYYPRPGTYYDDLTARSIGVGTTAVGSHLNVADNAVIGEGCAGYGAIGFTGTASCSNYQLSSSSGDTNLYINRPAGQNIHFKINNGADQITLDSSGNLGINPAGAATQKLDVNGHMILSSAAPNLFLGGATTYLGYPAANTLTFNTNTAEQIRLTSTGLGIGMVPTQKLDVTGNARVSGTTTLATANVSTALAVTNPGTFTAGGTSSLNGATAINSTLTVTGATTLGGATQINNTLGVTGVATLSSNASVTGTLLTTGLATFNPGGINIAGGALSVAGTSTLSGSTGMGIAPTLPYRLIVREAGIIEAVGIDGDLYNISGEYKYGPAPSDEQLKDNIHLIAHALAKTRTLKGVYFTWKDNKKRATGLTAQNVEKTFPELVYQDRKKMKHVQYPNLVGLLIEDVKDQQQQLDKIQQEIEQMKMTLNK